MNDIFLSNQVIIYLISEAILILLSGIAFVGTIGILRSWNFASYSSTQFVLERRAYLIMTILIFVFTVKFVLAIYLVFTIESLAVLVPGAMCGAGVISANDYGMALLFVKFFILFMLLLWMALNKYDLHSKDYAVIRKKSWLYLLIFVFVLFEGWLDLQYFYHIDLSKPVSCCSALFGQLEGANPLPFGLNTTQLLVVHYLLYVVLMIALWTKQRVVTLMSGGLFVVIAYFAVVYFFGTYVYELPTHKCPFCMMQREYGYVGYLIWGALFAGVFVALVWAIMGLGVGVDNDKNRRLGMLLVSLFVLICSSYVVGFYFKNGVLL